MKAIKYLLLLACCLSTNINAQQIYKEYRQVPNERQSKEIALRLSEAGNAADIDSLVDTLRHKLIEQEDYESYGFITNEYAIYLYYRGQLRAFDQLLQTSQKDISHLPESNFEYLLFKHFQTLMLRIKGENTQAAAALASIKDMAKKYDYPTFLNNCYNDLCTVNLQIGEYEKAFDAATKVLERAQPIEENDNHLEVAALYSNLGNSLLSKDAQLAQDYLEKAVDLFENTDKYHGQLAYRIMTMGALGRSYNQNDEYEKALATNQRRLTLALDSLDTGKLPVYSLAETYMDFFYTYFEAEKYSKMKDLAQEYYTFCNNNSEKIKTRKYNTSLRLLGYAYTMTGNMDSSLMLLQQAVKLETKLYATPYASPMIQSYLYLADTHFNRKEYKEAEQGYLNAIRCAIEEDSVLTKDNLHLLPGNNTYNVIEGLNHLQQVLYAAYQQDQKAQHLYKILKYNELNQEVLIHNHQLSQKQSSGLAFSYQLKRNNYYALKATEQLTNQFKQKHYADSAFLIAERTKLFHLRNNKAIAATIKTIPDSVLGNYQNLKRQIDTPHKTQSITQDFELNNAYFLSRLKLNRYFKDIDIRTNSQLRIENCPQGQSYISYTLYDSTLHICAFNNEASMIRSINVPKLKKTCKLLIRKVKTGADYSQEQKQLSAILIKPIEDIIAEQQNITVIPDSYLFELPYELLINNKHLLIEDYNINYQYAYSRVNEEKKTAYSLLAISPFAKEEGTLTEDLAELVRSNEGSTSLRGDQLVQLPYSGKEVKDISKIFSHQGLASHTLYGHNASKANIISALPQNTILHFATHGTSSNKKEETGLFLSQDEEETSSSLLSLSELYQLELKGDLAVLSACKSGMGNIKEGEGVLSLPRGFIYAGIPNIVASLWKVHDRKTKELMVTFYQHLIEDNMSYSQALRQAKCDCIEKGYTAMDWAGFVLISD